MAYSHGQMNLSEFRKKAGTYFVYEKYGIRFLIARPKPAQANDIWYAFDYSNWIDLKHLIVQYECRDYIILSTLRTNEAYKITKDKIYKASSAFGSDFKEWATGAWSNGQDYDVAVALKNDVRDSLYRILTIRSLGYQQLKEKGLDTVKLKLMADDIAKYFLHEMKTDQLKFLDSTVMSLSVYDKKKHEVSIVYQGDLYNVPMTVAEYESLQKNNADGLFSNRDYYFNGRKFKLCSFTITDPVTKKTFRYNAKTRVMERKTMLIETGSVSIKMPSE